MRRQPISKAPARGVSLVEAIVAMAVMAFGMMAVVGLQATLRQNSDIAKQRSEAVRIAQEAIEDWRAFSSLPTAAGQMAYADIGNVAGEVVTGYTTNTTYTLTRTVNEEYGQSLKALQVAVSWTDRNGDPQRIELDSIIARADPALSGALALPPPGGTAHQPGGRSPTIPPAAVNIGGDQSAYHPPGSPEPTVWVFDNLTGVITSVCTFPGTDLSQLIVSDQCFAQASWLISGFVRYSFGPHPDAASPQGLQLDLSLVALAVGEAYADGECYAAPVQSPQLKYTSYVCRVPQSADTTWTGSTFIRPPPVAGTDDAYDRHLYDVCRYSNGQAGNHNHPRVYVNLDRSLTNQNFLVVSEGVSCPVGTLPHQPVPS